MSFVACSAGGSFMPGSYLRFSPAPLMLSTVSASRAHSVIGASRDTTDATVVTQLPPPSQSAELRQGEACVPQCRYRWWRAHVKQKVKHKKETESRIKEE